MRLRRVLAAAGAVVAASLVLAGCASGSGSSTDSASSGSSDAAFPVSITTGLGTTTIESAPKRVVALGWGDAETALELGVQPVGASDWLAFGGDGVGPWLKGAYDKSPKIIQTLEPSYEDILKLNPDLILDVKSSGDKERYDKLSAIAPTLAIPKGGANYLASTEQQTTMIAKALGKESEGKKLLSGLDDAYAAARKAHPDFAGKTAVVGAYSSEGFGAYASTDSRSTFMRNLGFEIPKAIDQQAGKEFSVHLSDENLDLLDADLTLILPIYVDASEASSNKLFQKVPSVEAGHAIVFDDKDVSSAFSMGTTAAIEWALDKLPAEFEKKLG
ncbi:iron-siderophore ABC transporter substrate-binding protein [Curtobacterium flaccumfaciens pv. flaccumfaciens]|uniref:Iron-siderophore ABC transporter substrate-binding protein n=1 Tax=Curtobacterium flaccumfaciens pv. flaccumfaciens TaxID=138532 RepID=A0A9Q2W5I2_9MICO|nr:iron-siderophore ABC transporter substrate-binding protein [Curtobacterium flaccumfaciens pv. flaccumfaciens]MBT1596860.1 iron-siderophore ABC transporter substrate-binding protein [Curtobacterium flaccumfaciens pv. flaccumfaciens]MBT1611349.1 iron-siderophore ABC transporter substrate-binding protein [Curtobacterium flaccumfaciens pv. poinsettiae]MBT1620425.1 iron-siderophore ABC transporter substrate-binding protein [Curtobacterium flaccumfaciens pv. poinsettiae]